MLADALRLPLVDRAELASALLRSLEDEEGRLPPGDVERLWATEISRRAERAVRGESVGRDPDAVLDAIEAKLRPQ